MTSQNITVYGLKNCDTCRKAIKALEAAGKSPLLVDIREDTDLKQKLPIWLGEAGAPALVNKRSTTWRTLSAGEISKTDAGDALDVLIRHPTLIKRPVIEADGAVTVGWTKDIVAKLT